MIFYFGVNQKKNARKTSYITFKLLVKFKILGRIQYSKHEY
jgi:hypothetical protein